MPFDLVLSFRLPCRMVDLPRLGPVCILPSALRGKFLLTPPKRSFYQGGERAVRRASCGGYQTMGCGLWTMEYRQRPRSRDMLGSSRALFPTRPSSEKRLHNTRVINDRSKNGKFIGAQIINQADCTYTFYTTCTCEYI